MEQQTFSFRSISLSALLHALLLFLLLYLVQSNPLNFLPEEQQKHHEASVILQPTQAPQLQTTQTNAAASFDSAQDEREQIKQQPDPRTQTEKPAEQESHTSSPTYAPRPAWSPDRARQAWRKPTAPTQVAQPREHNPHKEYHDGLMHQIIDSIPIEEKGVPLKQRVNAQWQKEGQEHFQYGIFKTICYELNRQKIMEAPRNIPRRISFKVVLERSGKLVSAEMIEKSLSDRFDAACIRAIHAASPYRPVPASIEGDPVTLTFTLYHDRANCDPTSPVPSPIVFYFN